MLSLNKENIKQALQDVIDSAQTLLNEDAFDENFIHGFQEILGTAELDTGL